MARVKIQLADNIKRVVTVDTAATEGATIGRDLYLNNAVATPAAMREWLGLSSGGGGSSIRGGYGIIVSGSSTKTIGVNRAADFAWQGQHQWGQPLWMPNGSAAAPAATFTTDPDSGLYRLGANNIGFATGGTARWDVNGARTYQDVYAVIRNNSGLFVENPALLGAGVEITTIDGLDPAGDGVGNQLAFWETGTAANRNYGFRIRHTGEEDAVGNLDFYRHNNDTTGVLFMRWQRNTDQIGFGAGTAAEPSMSFYTDTNTGIYRVTTDQLGVATGGTLRLTAASTGLTATVPFLAPSGTVSDPGISFSADTNCGFYRISSNSIGFASSGILRWTWGNGSSPTVSTLVIQGPNGTAAAPTYGWSTDSDNGIYYIGTNNWGLSAGGTLRWDINTTRIVTTLPQQGPDGSVSAPAFTFSADTNNGLYRISTDRIGLSAGGTAMWDATTTAAIYGNTTNYPTHTFYGGIVTLNAVTNAELLFSASTNVLTYWRVTGAGTNAKNWVMRSDSGSLVLECRDDSLSNARIAWAAARSGNSITDVFYGNTTNYPRHTLFGPMTLTDAASGAVNAVTFRKGFVGIDTPFVTGFNLYSTTDSMAIGTSGAANLGLFANNAEKMRILSGGGVYTLAGVALGVGGVPDSSFHVNAAGAGNAGLRVGYAGTDVNYYDSNAHNFRYSDASYRSALAMGYTQNTYGNSTDIPPHVFYGVLYGNGGGTANTVSFRARNNGSYGALDVDSGGSGTTGYVTFRNPSGGYEASIGGSTTTVGSGGGTLPYVAGVHAFDGVIQAGTRLRRQGIITPAQITADTDNYGPTGYATAGVWRISTDASRNLTGIVAGTSGDELVLINVGSFDLVIIHDATSTAANRFLLAGGSDVTMAPGGSATFWYDATSARWRQLDHLA